MSAQHLLEGIPLRIIKRTALINYYSSFSTQVE